MAICDICGERVPIPRPCSYCGGVFCAKHRLPENHSCSGLEELSRRFRERGSIYRGVDGQKWEPPKDERTDIWTDILFGSEPERERASTRKTGGGLTRPFSGFMPFLKGLFFNNASLSLLLVMVLFFIGQLLAQAVFGSAYLYYIAPSPTTVLSRPWTVITSIFAHGSFLHLFLNGIVLFFIGSALEMRIGRKSFVQLFFVAGILAAIAQLLVIPPNNVILGASGAIFGILGTLTVLAPQMPILLFFFIPMPLWLLTLAYGTISAILAFSGGGGPIGHMAHFSGLVVGLVYGYKLRREGKGKYYNLFRRLIEERF